MDDNPPEFLNAPPISSPEISAKPIITFQGNNFDLAALAGVIIGGVTLISCGSLGIGLYCMPIVPVILGVIGLASVRESVNPERTRLLSWLSIGSGGIILLLILALIVFYIAAFVIAFSSEPTRF